MKINAKIVLGSAALFAVLALASMKREADSGHAGQCAGPCRPLMAALHVQPVAVSTNQITASAAAQQVIACYFHGTVRCETCMEIERRARTVIEQGFSNELAANRLMFTSLNYDLPENARFLQEYKLPCPSLVLVRQKDGKDEQWKLLGDVWTLVEAPVKFKGYVETEARNFLRDQAQQASAGNVVSPPAAGQR